MTIAAAVARGPLRLGARGDAVFALQTALRAQGAQIVADKVFGAITESAVKAFQLATRLRPDGIVGALTAAALDRLKAVPAEKPLPSSIKIAPHLSVMRAITGTKEVAGKGNNAVILGWATEIVARYPSLKASVGWYVADETPWCGLALAYACVMAGQKPPEAPLWALNWRDAWRDGTRLRGPTLGAIGVMSRAGGGHVTLYEGEDGAGWFGRGGNQSDTVNVAKFPHSRPVTWMWPRGLPVPNAGRVKTTLVAAVSARET
ncbi:MAG TPA: TIGR02594 family protein [Xanthobacteraceae bacterium]|nr:TIGR02594 family protein [Xanthobacteraceae bacterium]